MKPYSELKVDFDKTLAAMKETDPSLFETENGRIAAENAAWAEVMRGAL